MKPVKLYIKTHNKTGLKYFGKTVKENHNTYLGSGKRWRRHIKIHGSDITTEIILITDDKIWLQFYAYEFSQLNNIVESDEWANLREENGLDGGDVSKFRNYKDKTVISKIAESQRGKIVSEETRKKLSERQRGKPSPNKGNRMSNESKESLRQMNLGKKHTEESRKKNSDSHKGIKRPDVRERQLGKKHTEDSKKKMSERQRGKIVSAETRTKISKTLTGKIASDETKQKLSGFLTVVDKQGNIHRITLEQYNSQIGIGSDRDFVSNVSIEGRNRKQNKSNAVPVFTDEEAKSLSSMRR